MSTMTPTLRLLGLALCLSLGLSMESLKGDDGYEVFPAFPWSRYKMPSRTYVNWTDALAFCVGDAEGATLVVINSDPEAEVVKELVIRIDHPWVWAGINDIVEEGVWRTVQGGLLSSSGYEKWRPGSPAVDTRLNCGMVHVDGRYSNDGCSGVLAPFICEKPNV